MDYWRAQVIRCRDSGALDDMQEVAGELLRADYTDNGLPQPSIDGERLLPLSALAEAHVFVAYVSVERARAVQAGPSDPLWAAARRELSHADVLRSRITEPMPVPDLEFALRAALLIADSKPAEALKLAERTLADAPDSVKVDLLRVIGDAHVALSDAAAEPNYRAGLELANAQGRADQQGAITRSLVSQEETQGRLDKAVELIGRTVAGAVLALRFWGARLLIECYQPTTALRSLEDARPPDPQSVVEVTLLRAQAYRLLGRVGHALYELRAAVAAAEQVPASGRYAQLAQIHQLRGVVLGELLAVDEAEDCFQLAIGLWGEIGFAEGHPECSYLYRHFLIRDVGDLTAASRVARPALGADSDLAVRWAEDTAELRGARQETARPLSKADLSGLTPRQQARAIAAGLARSWSRHRHLLPALIEVLGEIQPPSARLLVVDELRRCEYAESGDIRRLRKAIGMTAPLSGHPADVKLQQSLLAELDRLSGNHDKARRELDESVAGLPPLPKARLARWRWMQARNRLRIPVSKRQVTALISSSTRYPLLQAVCLHVLASAEQQPGKSSVLLDQAMSRCQRVDRPTQWAAEIFRAAGQRRRDKSLLAGAADLDRQLGRPPQRAADGQSARIRSPRLPSQILADRPGEQAADLPGPDWVPPDLALQRRLVVEWPDLAQEMGEALFGGLSGSHEAELGLTALWLQSDEVAGQALLWELAIPPGPAAAPLVLRWPEASYRSLPVAAARLDIRWLQRALSSLGRDIPVDGVLGPITMDLLNAYFPGGLPIGPAVRRDLGRRLARPTRQSPVVVLLRPEAAVELAVSSHWDSGFDVIDLYTRFGFAVQTVRSLAEVPPPTEHDQVDILHVTGRMDIRGAAPYFDFSPAEMSARMGFKARGTDVSPKDIARWLRGCHPGQEPLVVLDPPYPGSPYDVPWQLVLRNMFTATLFAEASAPAIIATGVRASGASYIMPIAEGVRSGAPLATITSELRQAGGAAAGWSPKLATADWGIADDVRAALATAVFAAPSAFTLAAG